jgi:hypothetical protein
MDALTISTLARLRFVKIIVWESLVVPIDWLPKLIDEGLAFTWACATVPKANKMVIAAATV